MRARAVVLAVALSWRRSAPGPPTSWSGGTRGLLPQANAAVGEIVAAFEHETGEQVELVQPEEDVFMEQAERALQAGSPPDFLFSDFGCTLGYDDRLVDLEGVLGPVLDLGPAPPVRAAHGPDL